MSDSWPIIEADKIQVLNPNSPVALSVLWRKMDTIVPRLTDSQQKGLVAVGNLYSKDGINLMLRNIFAKPTIRRILLTGPDLSGSGEALINLINKGLDENHAIIDCQGAQIDKEISGDAIELFRKNVEVIDLRSGFELAKLDDYFIEDTEAWCKPTIFPERQLEEPDNFPSEAAGMLIRGHKISEVWLEILYHVARFGTIKGSEYGNRQREIIDLVSVVTDEDTLKPKLQPALSFTAEELSEYYEKMLTATPVPNVAYTYGQRMRDFHGTDQIAYMTQKLKEQPTSRRALAVLWDHQTDPPDSNPPCLITVQATIQDDILYLTAYIRSNDMFGGWPKNAFALRELQRQISAELKAEIGPLTIISQSAHIYENDWLEASKILEKFRGQKLALTDFDPRGNILVSIDKEAGEIVAMHQSPIGEKIAEYREASADKLIRLLDYHRAISQVAHATYIGMEIARAEMCLLKGIEYTQDRAPSL